MGVCGRPLSLFLLVLSVLDPRGCHANAPTTLEQQHSLRSSVGRRHLQQPGPDAWLTNIADSDDCASAIVATSKDGTVVATTTCDGRLQVSLHGNDSWHAVGPALRRPSTTTLWGIDLASETDVLALGGYASDGSSRVWVMAYHTHSWVPLGESFAVDASVSVEPLSSPPRDIVLSADGSMLSVTRTPIGTESVRHEANARRTDIFALDPSTHQWVTTNSGSDTETSGSTTEIAYYSNSTNDDITADGRMLQGTFEISASMVEYNDGVSGTPGISVPTVVVVFEHDDVTGVSPSITPYGDVEVTHYGINCGDLLTSPIGGAVQLPDIPNTAPLAPTPTPAPTFSDSVQTTILYDFNVLQSLSASAGLQQTDTSTTPSTTIIPFCVRLGLTSNGDEVAFREANIMVKYPIDDATAVTTEFTDNNPSNPTEELGTYSIQATFCSPPPSPLAQGQRFEVCLEPLDDTSSPTTDVVISVQDFLFFIDSFANNALDPGETSQIGVASGLPNTPSSSSPTCGVDVVTPASGVYGCRFTTNLRSDFFQPTPQTVLGIGSITISFVISRTIARDSRVAPAATIKLVVGGNGGEEEEEGCTDNCFFLLCWAVWIWCSVKDFFGFLSSAWF